MKHTTGLKDINGKLRHTPQVKLFWDECLEILQWLPKGEDLPGGKLQADLERCMKKAKLEADTFNTSLAEQEERWQATGTKEGAK